MYFRVTQDFIGSKSFSNLRKQKTSCLFYFLCYFSLFFLKNWIMNSWNIFLVRKKISHFAQFQFLVCLFINVALISLFCNNGMTQYRDSRKGGIYIYFPREMPFCCTCLKKNSNQLGSVLDKTIIMRHDRTYHTLIG